MLVEFVDLRRYGKGRKAYYAIRLGSIIKIKRWPTVPQPPGQPTTERNGSRLRIRCHRPGRIAGCPSWAKHRSNGGMHLQNRVTPFGEIVAISQRGMFTGNRGIIHDPATKTLGTRRWTTKTWLVCSCEYRGRRRSVMAGRSWTELFFLDEAVALSAGHRPCFRCRREAAKLYRAAWAAAKGTPLPVAAAIDAVLHRERLKHGRKRMHPIPAPALALPDGAVVVAAGSAFTLSSGLAYRWTNGGYDLPVPLHRADGLLTPPSTLMALSAGYRPVLHPSIRSSNRTGEIALYSTE
jgi:hypothetical protein